MPDATRREALLDQLRYLLDEATMLRHVIGRIPEAMQEARVLESSLSLKETLALLAALDARVRLPHLERLRTDADAAPEPPDEAALVAGAHALATETLLDVLAENRGRLVAAAEDLRPEEWTHAEAYLYAVTQEDADRLRTLTQQLFDVQGFGR